jgi:hypothetical protein
MNRSTASFLSTMFSIPEEVIWELSQNDDADYYNEAGADYAPPRKQVQVERVVSCGDCGFNGLVERETPHGRRLVYSSQAKVARLLVGKIHQCQE